MTRSSDGHARRVVAIEETGMRRFTFMLVVAAGIVWGAAAARAETVYLRTNCVAAGYTLGVDCFQNLNTLDAWLWNGGSPRDPSRTSPVVVDVGAGSFGGRLICPTYHSTPLANDPGHPNGHVTFRGVSRKTSTLRATDPFTGIFMATADCDGIEFQDVRIEAPDQGFFRGIAFIWNGEGSATFTDVEIDAAYSSWYDSGCESGSAMDGPLGEHYFWGAQLTSGSLGYFADCGRTWLYGSEILVRPQAGTNIGALDGVGSAVIGVKASHRGDVRLFGSSIRVDASALASSVPVYGVVVGAGGNGMPLGEGQFHMHGGIINVSAGSLDRAVIGVHADTMGQQPGHPAMAHIVDTAFQLRTGSSGTATRTSGNGMLQAPFLWQSGTMPPVTGSSSSLGSLTGQDLFVETDCDGSGCGGSGTNPHLMIYKADCPNSPWFDVVRNACRD